VALHSEEAFGFAQSATNEPVPMNEAFRLLCLCLVCVACPCFVVGLHISLATRRAPFSALCTRRPADSTS
jgi:hypothetical protein